MIRAGFLRLLVGAALAAGCAQAPADTEPETAARRILIVAPAESLAAATEFGRAVEAAGNQQATAVAMADYAPLIDERAFDGFVVFAKDAAAPKPGLIEDLRRTAKPLIWAGRHAELLGQDFFDRLGLSLAPPPAAGGELQWRNRSARVEILHSVAPKDPQAAVFSLSRWAGAGQVVGAASGRFAIAGFAPTLDPASADTDALLWLARRMFGAFAEPASPAPDFAARVAQSRADPFASAVHLPVYIAETRGELTGYDGDALHANLVRIADAGAEWVVIQRILYQDGTAANEIYEDPVRTVTFASLSNVISDARKLGLKIRFVPVVNLSGKNAKPGDWRGFIRPSDPDRWWARYREIVLEDAVFARDHEIEALDLGAELSAQNLEDARWRQLAADVRNVAGYRGMIGYQANFDVMTRIRWTDAIDYLAVAAYWPLAETPTRDVRQLLQGWERVWRQIGPWIRERPGLRVEFGEIGYAAQPFASVLPFSWKPDRQGRLDTREQLACYLALETFLKAHPEVRGVSIFASTKEDTDPEAIGYSPFAKPAAEVVRRILRR